MNTGGAPRWQRVRVLVLVVVVTVGSVVGGLAIGPERVAAANESGYVTSSHDINATDPNARFDPGQGGTIDVRLTNYASTESEGDDPPKSVREEAEKVQFEYVNISDTDVASEEEAPLTIQTDGYQVNDGWVDDRNYSGPHPFDVQVDEDAKPGTYLVNVTTEYTHYSNITYENGSIEKRTETREDYTDTLEVEIQPQADFDVTLAKNNTPLGGEGTIAVAITNTGGENITGASVSVTSQDSDFYFGSGTATSEANVGDWDPGVEKTLEFRAGTVESAVKREYPIDVSVDYTDSEGTTASDSTQIGITPGQRDHFEVTDVDHDVPENGEGMLEITAQQTWKQELDEVTVTASTTATDVYLGSPGSQTATTYVENWYDGDYVRDLRFRVGTEDAALDREYPIELQFEYTDRNDNQNTQTQYVHFSPTQRSVFEVESVDHDVPRNGEGTLTVEMERLGDKAVEDVTVTASTADSAVFLGTEGSTAATRMVGDWDDGADETATFRVGTTDAAVEQPYPLELTIEYTDDENNENSRTKTVEFTPGAGGYLSIADVRHTVPRDGVGPVRVVLKNTAEKRLSDLTATASSSDSEIYLGSESSRSGAATIEELAPGENRTITYQVGATANAVNRTYPLSLSLAYTDAHDNDNQQEEQIEFRPRPEPRFLVEEIGHDVPVGSTGRVAITLTNAGPINATETVVTASSEADAMYFGTGGTEPVEVQGVSVEPPQTGTPTAQTYVGNWSAGETRTVHFRAGFDQDAIRRAYVTDLAIRYENQAGDQMPERTRSVGLEPLPEQQFQVNTIESTLHVGEEGDLVVEVKNGADRPVDGVVLRAESQGENVNFYNARYALGTLDAGETAHARFSVGVTAEAEPGPKVFELSGRYRDPQGEIRQSDSRDVLTKVGPDRDAFELSVSDATFTPGETGSFAVEVTNQRNETLRNIQGRLFTDDPLDSEDDSAFIQSLDPGESETITLDLSVGGTASEKTYSASLDFRFDNERGDSELSDTQRVPVTVQESGSIVGPLLLAGVVVIGVLAVIGYRVIGVDRLLQLYRERVGP